MRLAVFSYLYTRTRSRPRVRTIYVQRCCSSYYLRLSRPPLPCPGLRVLFRVLSTRLGAFVLTGRAVPFYAQSLAARHALLKRWSVSRIGKFREAFQVSAASRAQVAFFRSEGLSRATWFVGLQNRRKRSGFLWERVRWALGGNEPFGRFAWSRRRREALRRLSTDAPSFCPLDKIE